VKTQINLKFFKKNLLKVLNLKNQSKKRSALNKDGEDDTNTDITTMKEVIALLVQKKENGENSEK
jgi:hypothetical protein